MATFGEAIIASYDSDNHAFRANLATTIAGEDTDVDVLGVLPKPVESSTYAPSTFIQFGTSTKSNIKAAPGNVYSVYINNANAAIRYLQLHNKATTPAATDVPALCFAIPAGGYLTLPSDFFMPSEYFITGIGWSVSTTAGTFTDSATASEHLTVVRYV